MNPLSLRAALALVSLSPFAAKAGLLAHWKLDSSPADEAGSFAAVWNSGESYTASVAAPSSNAAATLDGTWLKAGGGIDFERDQSFSATAWIKGGTQDSTVIGDMVSFEDYRGWELHVGTDVHGGNANSVTVWLIHDYPANAIQVNAAVPVLDGQWHHVAFTYDGSSSATGVKIYIDGAEVAATAGLDSLGSSIANGTQAELNLGSRMNGNGHNFTGALDEIALFDHALSAAEMTLVFQAGIESIGFPSITATLPQAGQAVDALTTAEVTFSFPVGGVDASDLLVNGTAASGVEELDPKHYRFTFPTPPPGDVHFTWAAGHGIAGLNGIAAQPEGWSVLFTPVLPAPQAAIAEFLCKNAGGLEDEDHDSPDWIELVNPGTAIIDLGGWALTDDPARPRRWVMPSFTLQPGARKIIFASGKDRKVASGTLHTNFKLADEGGYLALSDPSGAPVHVFDGYPRQEGNVSFGLLATGKPADGRAAWRYLTPTPGGVPSAILSGAAISSMESTPAAPQAGQPITVTIRLSPEAVPAFAPILTYKIMHGSDLNLNFADNGLNGDGAAGDGVWGATIPATATAGQMVRWRARVTSNGTVSRWPVNANPNSALPLHEGTVIGGTPAGQALPVYQVFVPGYTFPTSTSQTGIDSDAGARGAFYGNGKLYDNVLIRIKGTTSRYLFKRSHRVDFNPGRDFEWSPDFPAQREVNLNSEFNDPSYLRQNHQLWMHRDSGGSGSEHFPVRLLMNGAHWQLAFHTYSADSELVETMGLDPRGAIYKQVGTLSTGSGAEKKSRRWEGTQDYTDFRNGIASGVSVAAKSRYVHDNTNLPAVINYLAVARIAQEADDVWANMVIYRDSEGTREWQPIPFDLNLSFGQLFYGGVPDNMTVHANHDNNKGHPLYGSSTCQPTLYGGNGWNRLYDAIIQNPVTRSMLLRRMRTLTDRYLATDAANSPLEDRFNQMGTLIGPDADTDRARWGLPPNSGAYGLGPGISPAQGLATLKSDFLAPRRTHFYTTHSINNPNKTLGTGNNHKAGIPDAQVAAPVIVFGTVEAHPASGNQDQEYIQLNNPGSDAIDVSDWTLRGSGGTFVMKGGTVIPAGGSLYISPDVVAFRTRGVSPKANENRFVVGPFPGHLSPYGEELVLEDADGAEIASTAVAADPDAPPVALHVTEILSNSAHTDGRINGDWWELTNTAATPVELAGFSWDDSRGLPGQAVFPAITLAAGESAVILDEDDDDEAALFRAAWNLPASVKILTREDFNLPDGFRGLGNGDSVIVYLPDGSEVARADYPAHQTGKSRAWFRNGNAIPGNYSQAGDYAASASNPSPADEGSPGFAAADPATLTEPYDIWAASNNLWSTAALPATDADGDGRSNREEYLFGGLPAVADHAPPQRIERVGGDIEWTLVRRSDDPSLVFHFEASEDLLDWENFTPVPIAQTPHPALPGYVAATYRVTPDDTRKFFRARAN